MISSAFVCLPLYRPYMGDFFLDHFGSFWTNNLYVHCVGCYPVFLCLLSRHRMPVSVSVSVSAFSLLLDIIRRPFYRPILGNLFVPFAPFYPHLPKSAAKLQHLFRIIAHARYVFKHIFETIIHNSQKTSLLYVSFLLSQPFENPPLSYRPYMGDLLNNVCLFPGIYAGLSMSIVPDYPASLVLTIYGQSITLFLFHLSLFLFPLFP